MQRGLLAEFESAGQAAAAIEALREHGFRGVDAVMPYAAEPVMKALRVRRSPLPYIAFGCGVLGAAVAYLILWWTQAVAYPLNIGGRPNHAVPAFVPITFETAILFAGGTAFVGGLVLAGLPRLHQPLYEQVAELRRASVDRFFVLLRAEDPGFDALEAERLLEGSEPVSLRWIGGEAGEP